MPVLAMLVLVAERLFVLALILVLAIEFDLASGLGLDLDLLQGVTFLLVSGVLLELAEVFNYLAAGTQR